MNKPLFLCLLAAWLVPMDPGRAATYQLQDHGNTTIDPNTGLEWLDLSFTAGQSYQSVHNGWNGYTTTQGYRFATRSEVTQLFLDAGANGTWAGPTDPANLQPATLTLSLLGATQTIPGSYSKSWMFYDPATEPGLPTSAYASSAVFGWSMDGTGNNPAGFFSVPGLFPLTDYSSPELASALVRTVPEPCALAFTSLALGLLAMERGKGFGKFARS